MTNGSGPPVFGSGFAAPEPPRPVPWFLDIAGVFRRHWLLVIVVALGFTAAAYSASGKYKTEYWTIEGKLRYTKPSHAESSKIQYDPMTISSYADMLTADETLRKVIEEFQAQLPANVSTKALQNQIKVEPKAMGDMIEIKWETANPELAIAIVNRLMALHVEATNALRRETILRQAKEVLRHNIADCDAQMSRLRRTISEYQSRLDANPTIEKLEKAELDAYFAQRRKSILDLIQVEKTRVREAKIEADAKLARLKTLEDHYKKDIVTREEVINSSRDYQVITSRISVIENNIKDMEKQYRDIPIEYADKKITDLQILKEEAELNLKTLEEKLARAAAENISPVAVDPLDDAWGKLRKWLMGPDSAEFSILKEAGWPTAASGSNRKMLMAAGVGGPLALLFLLLALFDHVRGVKPPQPAAAAPATAGEIIPPPAQPARNAALHHEESALLTMRIQQWIDDPPARTNSDGPAKPWKPLTVDRDPTQE